MVFVFGAAAGGVLMVMILAAFLSIGGMFT